MSIFDTNGTFSVDEEVINGRLVNDYYDKANHLYDKPVVNTSKYEFKEYNITASCELFNVDITINDERLNFPYNFSSTYDAPYFTVNVKMTYLGESFTYTHSNGYKAGATVSFINNDDSIYCEPIIAPAVISQFSVMNGEVIEDTYYYYDRLMYQNNLIFENTVGTYDMYIEYENKYNNVFGSIIIEDFLTLTR